MGRTAASLQLLAISFSVRVRAGVGGYVFIVREGPVILCKSSRRILMGSHPVSFADAKDEGGVTRWQLRIIELPPWQNDLRTISVPALALGRFRLVSSVMRLHRAT